MYNYETYKHARTVKERYVAIKDLDIEERKTIPLVRITSIFSIQTSVLSELKRHNIETLGQLFEFYKLGVHKFTRVNGVGEKNLSRLLYLIEKCFPEEMFIERTYYSLDKSETKETKEYWHDHRYGWRSYR
jgi:hypothetical protein